MTFEVVSCSISTNIVTMAALDCIVEGVEVGESEISMIFFLLLWI